tara:strand:+ start:117 stop:818 length:702 start_codon:yes stop_codon:yes gene_type:complete
MKEFKYDFRIKNLIYIVSGFYVIDYVNLKAEQIVVEKIRIKLSNIKYMDYFTNDWFTDIYILRNILEHVEFQTSSTRNKQFYCPKKLGGSMLYGSTFRQHPKSYNVQREQDPNNPKLNLTKAKSDYPELEIIFREFANLYFVDFKYNSIQMNKNYMMGPHLDGKNIGASILVSIGNYLGGDTCLFNEKSRVVEKYDARQEPLEFDGSKILHWVDQIKSKDEDRYSLVFFNGKN